VSGGPFTYDGDPHAATATATGIGGAIVAGSFTFTYTPPGDATIPVNAGTYVVSAAFTSSDTNYANATGNGEMTIEPATPTVSIAFEASPIPYDGNPHPATVTVTGVDGVALTDPADGTIATSYNPSGTPTNAGAYTASATFTSSNPNYTNASSTTPAELTIDPATPTVSVAFTPASVTYDGNPHPATVTVTGVGGAALTAPGDGTIAIEYKKGGSVTGTPTDAGSYTASATFTSINPNYTNADSTVDATLTIDPATPTVLVTFPASPITYDGNPHPATASVTGVGGATLADPADGTIAITYNPTGPPMNAGAYTASATFTSSNPNYTNASSTTDAQLTIQPATPTIEVTGGTFTYDGGPHAATATAKGVGGVAVPGSFAFTYTPPGNATVPVNAGDYDVIVAFTSSDTNYTNANGSGSIEIEQATPTVTVSGGPFTYDTNPHSATVAVTGVGGVTVSGTSAVTYAPPGDATVPVNAGTYVVSVAFTSSDSNYKNATGGGSITIDKAPLTITANSFGVVFGQPSPAFNVSYSGFVGLDTPASSLAGTLAFSFAGTPPTSYGPSTVIPTAVGTYAVRPSGLTSVNYAITFAPGTFTINAWALTGFYQPVGIPNSVQTAPGVALPTSGTVWNTIKGGQTVPLKFEIFETVGGIERTSVADVSAFTLVKVPCSGGTEDAVEPFPTSGATVLRYDATEGQFVQNWQSPKGPSQCYRTTMTALDGSSISAFFRTK
jgi:hypothetical protein